MSLKPATPALPAAPGRGAAADYLELTKPRISGMVLFVTFAGYFMAAPAIDPGILLAALAGTGLIGSGASAMNHWMERDHDARMDRTRNRPLPAGRLSPGRALAFGLVLSFAGVFILAAGTNFAAASLALLSHVTYVFLYTPVKRITMLNTVLGAIPGALPVLIGWAAATGSVSPAGFSLFLILFFWQLPHFLAIAWMYREDYERGGFQMVCLDDPAGERVLGRFLRQSFAMVAASLAPAYYGIVSAPYALAAVVLGAGFLAFGIYLAVRKTKPAARSLVLASVAYLPLLFGAMMAFKA